MNAESRIASLAAGALVVLVSLVVAPSRAATGEPSFDDGFYYRLTTEWQGEGKSLDIVNDGRNNKPILAKTDDVSGQHWKLTRGADGFYRLTTEWQGEGKSLDIINDGENNKPILAKTDDVSGQAWKITPLGKGFYRLTTEWQGKGKSLDVVNDGQNNQLKLAETGTFSGQSWKITRTDVRVKDKK